MCFDIFLDGMEKTINTTVRIIGLRVEIWTRNSPKRITQPHNTVCRFDVAMVDASRYDALSLTHEISDIEDFDSSRAEI